MSQAAYQQTGNHQTVNQQQPQVVQAKFSYTPLIMTTLITTVVTLGVGFAFSRWTEKRKEEEEERKEREREERAAMMPPMPMMWPGAAPNPGAGLAAMGPARAPAPAPSSAPSSATQSELNDIVDRLQAWQEDLQAREQHLRLVVGDEG